jgi:uncharacterized protein (TIGR00288 family)
MARLALLIDGENVGARYFAEIARHCLAFGDLRSAQVFADFSEGRRASWLEVCRDFGLQPQFQLSRKGKNSVDIAMTIAAMDLMHEGAMDAICLVSTDRDFIPLAQRLRQTGMAVIGIGLATDDKSLAEACDSYFLLAPVAKPKALTQTGQSVAKPAQLVTADERGFLIDLINDLWRGNKSAPFAPALLGSEMRRRRAVLADRLGGKKLLKRLNDAGVVTVHGSGAAKLISPAKAA